MYVGVDGRSAGWIDYSHCRSVRGAFSNAEDAVTASASDCRRSMIIIRISVGFAAVKMLLAERTVVVSIESPID